jgi:hypothetical protein
MQGLRSATFLIVATVVFDSKEKVGDLWVYVY